MGNDEAGFGSFGTDVCATSPVATKTEHSLPKLNERAATTNVGDSDDLAQNKKPETGSVGFTTTETDR